MSDLQQLGRDFMAAIAANDQAQFEALLAEDAGLRLNRWDGREIYRPRARVIQRIRDEWAAWPDATLETFDVLADGPRIAIEYRIQATENTFYVEHNRSAFLTITDNKISTIDLFCPEPMYSARRKNWIAPATLEGEELNRVLQSTRFGFDVREWIWPDSSSRMSLRGGQWGNGSAHPGANGVGGVRWTAEEADRRIEETIAYFRERNIGFQWWVDDTTEPADMCERLEKHGLVLAGDAATMARVGLDNLDIPINPDIEIEIMDGYAEAAVDAMCHINIVCFQMPQEQIDRQRAGWVERMRNPKFREKEINYLAKVDGQHAAFARLVLGGGIAYQGGAGTLPEFRGRNIYSTLVRRRLADAQTRGYHLAVINAEPLSRPIVTRCGFKEYGRAYIYAWMPVIDMDVIKSLVPQ
ncbi:MAG: nuclear transport factor 2 family protein [Chloroflexi bacterium]|nr:nuclear transport factor 2 family protein [Chloroflexota bacterium]